MEWSQCMYIFQMYFVDNKVKFYWAACDISYYDVSENLSPSELRKLKNKQRKAKKRAQAQAENKKAEQDKKETQSKKAQDGELDGPKEEELVPEKLARVSFVVLESLNNDKNYKFKFTKLNAKFTCSFRYSGNNSKVSQSYWTLGKLL